MLGVWQWCACWSPRCAARSQGRPRTEKIRGAFLPAWRLFCGWQWCACWSPLLPPPRARRGGVGGLCVHEEVHLESRDGEPGPFDEGRPLVCCAVLGLTGARTHTPLGLRRGRAGRAGRAGGGRGRPSSGVAVGALLAGARALLAGGRRGGGRAPRRCVGGHALRPGARQLRRPVRAGRRRGGRRCREREREHLKRPTGDRPTR